MPPPSQPPSPKWHRYLRFWRGNVAADVDDEIAFHLDARTEELIVAGMTPADARDAALREFGDVTRARTTLRDMDEHHATRRRQLDRLGDTWQDVRVAVRSLRRSPGLVVVVALTLALGIGLNSAVYSIVDAYLLRPMPVPNGRDLVVLAQTDPALAAPHEMSYPNFRDYRADTAIFRDLAAHAVNTMNLSGGRTAERLWVEEVTANFFDVLGVKPALGRLFAPGDDVGELAHPYIVLTWDFWQSRFGGNARVVGDTIRLNDRPVTVIGITPRGFQGIDGLLRVDGFTAINQTWPSYSRLLDQRNNLTFNVIGRLRPGLTLAAARQALGARALQLEREYPADNRNVRVVLMPETRARPNIAISGNIPVIAAAFMVLVMLVLAIACANVASLLLARAVSQHRERAIRAALGASQWQLVRRVIVECLLLATLGGVGALLLARLAVGALSTIKVAADFPIQWQATLDGRVVAFTLGIIVLTALISSAAPALAIRRVDLNEALKSGGRGGAGTVHQRLRGVLVVAQMAVCVVILVCAALFARSTRNASRIDPGFRPDHLVIATATLGAQGYDSIRGKELERDVLKLVAALPGVRNAALARYTPFGYNNDIEYVFPEASPVPVPESGYGYFNNVVTPSYFATMNIPIIMGRAFTDRDDEDATKVAVVTNQFARALWPGQPAIGKRFRFGRDGPMLEIVGVAGDIQYFSIGEAPKPFVFRPYAQAYRPTFTISARTAVAPASIVPALRVAVASLDPTLPLYDVRTMDDHIKNGRALFGTRLGAAFASVFGVLALVLATIGVYGLVSYSVTQRTREIGIRMALGARTPAVMRLVVRQGLSIAVIGVAFGAALALVVTRLLAGLLYGVAPRDPVILTAVAGVLVTIAVVASLIPAGRATRVDPVAALRAE
jgi:predicted permease